MRGACVRALRVQHDTHISTPQPLPKPPPPSPMRVSREHSRPIYAVLQPTLPAPPPPKLLCHPMQRTHQSALPLLGARGWPRRLHRNYELFTLQPVRHRENFPHHSESSQLRGGTLCNENSTNHLIVEISLPFVHVAFSKLTFLQMSRSEFSGAQFLCPLSRFWGTSFWHQPCMCDFEGWPR